MPLVSKFLVFNCNKMIIDGAQKFRTGPNMGIEVIPVFPHTPRLKAELTPRGENNQLFPGQSRLKRLITARQIERECFVDTDNLVKPRFKRGRHSVVIHGYREQNDICTFNFVDESVRKLQRGLLGFGSFFFRCKGRADPVLTDRGWRVKANITLDNLVGRALFQPFIDKAPGEPASQGTFFSCAHIYTKNCYHVTHPQPIHDPISPSHFESLLPNTWG